MTKPMSAAHQYTSVSGCRSNTSRWVVETPARYPPVVCMIPLGLAVVPEV